MIKRFIQILLLQPVVALSLFSDDGYRFGLGVSFLHPKAEASMGPYFTVEKDLTNIVAFRGSLGYARFRERKDGFGIRDDKRITGSTSLETDLIFGRGLYVSTGIGAMNNTWKSTDAAGGSYRYYNFISSIGAGVSLSDSKHRLQLDISKYLFFL